ncbi:MAG: HNH/ENDO VII family nuclease [Serratia liquefaciens]|nr:HNH/ENDO VII family nuclease [Serratia liquefaciens]
MDAGRAPIGTDGKPVNLHHMFYQMQPDHTGCDGDFQLCRVGDPGVR